MSTKCSRCCFSSALLFPKSFLFMFVFIFFFSIGLSLYAEDLIVNSGNSGTTGYSINTSYYAVSQVSGSASAGTTTINVATVTGFVAGQDILILTMQGNTVGQYELNKISSISSSTLTLESALSNTYTTTAQIIAFKTYDNVTIENSGVLTCDAWDGSKGGVLFINASNLTVDSTSFIDVSEKGFLGSTGAISSPASKGADTSNSAYGGGGGAYGGDGSDGYTTIAGGAGYGLFYSPVCMGSAGGRNSNRNKNGGKGGGIIFIKLTGTATIDGTIQSNGQNSPDSYSYNGGGGAGGSIFIIANSVSGVNASSFIRANGGSNNGSSYCGGGGGGGRIAVLTDSASYNYPGLVSAYGGLGYNGMYGGAGTFYLKEGTDEKLRIENTTYICDYTQLNDNGQNVDINVLYIHTAKVNYAAFEGCNTLEIRNCDQSISPSAATVFDSISFSVLLEVGAKNLTLGSTVNVNHITVAGLDSTNKAVLNLSAGVTVNTSVNLNGFTTLNNSTNFVSPAVAYLTNNDNDITNNSTKTLRMANLNLGESSAVVNNGIIEVTGNVFTIGNGSSYDGTGTFDPNDTDNNLTVESGGSFISKRSDAFKMNSVLVKTGASFTHTNNTTSESYKLNFDCTGDFTIESGVTINLTGSGYNSGYGTGKGNNGSYSSGCPHRYTSYPYYSYTGGGGAAYGGNGSNANGGTGGTSYYGSVVNPINIGSGGGIGYYTYRGTSYYDCYQVTTYYGGAGGGTFIANVGGTFTLNGSILADGGDGNTGTGNAGGGGGSGGSINITAGSFTAGSGTVISANGGKRTGSGYGGGGGGGRIAIKASTSYNYEGTMSAYGNDGFNGYGGAGTIYLRKGAQEEVYVKNTTNAARALTYITNTAEDSGNFTNVVLYDIQYVSLNLTNLLTKCETMQIIDSVTNISLNNECTINTLNIDATSSTASRRTTITSAFPLYMTDATVVGKTTSIHGELSLPVLTRLGGTLTLNGYTTLYNYGYINLLVKNNTDNDIYNYSTGRIEFPSLTLKSGEIFEEYGVFSVQDSNLTIDSGSTFNIDAADTMTFNNVVIKGTVAGKNASASENPFKIHFVCLGNFTMDSTGSINVSGKGYSYDQGPGKGATTATTSYGGGGGAYGGDGSDGYYVTDSGGNMYGSLTDPREPGSGGGSSGASYGGAGGGAVVIEVPNGTLTLNGPIQANGGTPTSGAGRNGGGGSGGCVNLRALNMAGTCTIQVLGGARYSTSYYGGGGGGGRIAIVCANESTFTFNCSYYGADGYNTMYGGAGTYYTKIGGVEKLYVTGSAIANRDYTVINDLNVENDEINLALFSASQANVKIAAVASCNQFDVTNSDMDFTEITHPLNIPLMNIVVDSALSNRRVKINDKINITDVSLDGYNTTKHAELELLAGATISGSLVQAGNSYVENNSVINLPTTYTFTGSDNDLTNNSTGEIILPTLVINSNSYVINAGIISPVDEDLTLNGGTYDLAKSTTDTYTDIWIKSGGLLTHQQNTTDDVKINIACANLQIDSGGTMDASAKGYPCDQGPGKGAATATSTYGGGGGAYGGKGSPGYSNVSGGTEYGSLINPVDYGSGGGSNTGGSYRGGSGGGIIFLNVSGTITLNGIMKCDGEKAPNGSSPYCGGGGAGGTIRINTDIFTGTGTIQANGGDNFGTSYYGGGGSGGRIAVTCNTNTFGSNFYATGSYGYSSYGAAGTIYFNVNNVKSIYIKNNYNSARETTIIQNNDEVPSAIELLSIKGAEVDLQKNSLSVNNVEIVGNNSAARGTLYVPAGVTINTQISLNGYTTLNNYTIINLPNNFLITGADNIINNYAGGRIVFASMNFGNTAVQNDGVIEIQDKILRINNGSTYYNDKQLTTNGVADPDYDLIVESGGTYVSETANTIYFKNVNVKNGGRLLHKVNTDTVEYTLNINCSQDFLMEGLIDTTGAGYAPASTGGSDGVGPGAGIGTTNTSYGGSGAGHGGDGSDAYSLIPGGVSCDSLVNPTELGSSGGNTYHASYKGSSGGGAVLLNVAGTMTINGNIKVNADNVANRTGNICGGGGAGGSVNIHASTITGTNVSAVIEAKGGSRVGTYYGGGGAGGRVALICTTYTYPGKFDTAGGSGYYKFGAAGTVYVEDSSSKHILMYGNTTAGSMDTTIIDGTVPPADINTYTVSSANLILNKLNTCQTMTIINSEVNINTPDECTINTASVTVNSSLSPRRTVLFPNTRIRNLSVQGYSTTRHAEIELRDGSKILDLLEINGYTGLFNYTDLNLPGKTVEPKYVLTGSDNDIINYPEGELIIPDFIVSQSSVVQNFGSILPVDTNLTIESGGTYDLAKNVTENYSNVVVSGTLTHTANSDSENYKIKINCTNFTVNSGGIIDVSGKGYTAGNGPGAGANTSNSGYGGGGGAYGASGTLGFSNVAAGQPYGSIKNPLELGSAGGSNTYRGFLGGSGGGAVRIIATSFINNGTIKSNGNNSVTATTYNGGAGSGGSINIDTGSFGGTGSFQVIGGHNQNTGYYGGGGSGGRISVKCDSSTFAGSYDASGNFGYNNIYAPPGTVYVRINGVESLYLENKFSSIANSIYIYLDEGSELMTLELLRIVNAWVRINKLTGLNNVFMQGNNSNFDAILELPSGVVDVSNLVTLNGYTVIKNYVNINRMELYNHYNDIYNYSSGSITVPTLNMGNYSLFESYGNFNIEDKNLIIGSYSTYTVTGKDTLEFANITIRNNGLMTHLPNTTQELSKIDIHCTGNFTIDSGGKIDVSAKGYYTPRVSGANGSGPGAGTGTTNVNSGGGGGGYGGCGSNGRNYSGTGGVGGMSYGSIDNPIDLGSSGGNTTTYYGGSGGGAVIIDIDGTFTLNGYIYANGENSVVSDYRGGAGSGGSVNITADTFAGTVSGVKISAIGGYNYGTSYYGGGGLGGRVAIKCNTYTCVGTIDAYGQYGYGSGTYYGGAGTVYTKIGSQEKLDIVNTANSGYYASKTPLDQGSSTLSINNLNLKYAYTELVNMNSIENVSALNSKAVFDPVIPYTINNISIQRNANAYGSTVIGENIVVESIDMIGNSSYKPDLTVENGATIATRLDLKGYTQVLNYGIIDLLTKSSVDNDIYNYPSGIMNVDNLNLSTNSYFQYSGTITILDTSTMNMDAGSTFMSDTLNQLCFGSVWIKNTALMSHMANGSAKTAILNIATTGDFTIDSGGKVDVSGKGYVGGEGTGKGANAPTGNQYGGGGAGYGGAGGVGYSNIAGGITYGDRLNPMDLGSGGGTGYASSTPYTGGAGGGVVRLNVSGNLTVNGIIYANGNPSSALGGTNVCGGGGSGGSIYINTNGFAGTATTNAIQANGANNYTSYSTSYRGGGGGGGRVYIGYQTLSYNKGVQANGGSGYNNVKGVTGTVEISVDPAGTIPMSANPAQLIANSNQITVVTAGPVKDAITNTVPDGTEITVSASEGSIVDVTDTNPNIDGIQLQTVSGNVTFSVKADIGVNEGTIIAETDSVNGTAHGTLNIPVVIGIPAGTFVLNADPAQIVADGNSTTTINSQPIKDAYGNIIHAGAYVTISTSLGTITTADANTTISGRQVVVGTDGTITFTVKTTTTSGTANVTATTSGISGNASGSVPVEMVPGALSKLVAILPGETFSKTSGTGKTGTPSAHTAGSAYTVKVYAVDVNYNIIKTLTDLIELESSQEFAQVNPVQQAFPGNNSTDRIEFSVTEYISGTNISLTIKDLTNSSYDTVSSNYNIVSATAKKLQIILPGETAYPGSVNGKTGSALNQRSGIPFYIYINIVDQYFNKVTGRTDKLTITSNGSGAVLPAPNLVNGSAYVEVAEYQVGSGRMLSASVSDSQITSAQSALFGVFYTLPEIISISPNECKPGISKVVTVSGTDFVNGTTIEVLGGGIDVTNVVFNNSTSLSVTLYVYPTATLGERDVKVINPEGSEDIGGSLFIIADNDFPAFSNITAPKGATAGDQVTIEFDSSELLASNPTVTLDGNQCTFQSETDSHYIYKYDVIGTENSGYADILIQGTDFVGNTGYGMVKILLDFNDPVIANSKIDPLVISPNNDFKNDSAVISFSITDESNEFDIKVIIKSGITTIKTLWDGSVSGKYFYKIWDGKDQLGNYVPNGNYIVEVSITDPAGNSIAGNIGTVTVNYSADIQPYIVFKEEVQFATITNEVINLPITVINNGQNVHGLTLLDVINNDNTVQIDFVDDPLDITLDPTQEQIIALNVDSTVAAKDRVDIQLRLTNEQPAQIDYSYMRIYMNPVPKPDLVVTVQDITIVPGNPDVGVNTQIKVKIRNVGNDNASNIPVSFTSFGNAIGSGTIVIPSLAAGADVTITNNVTFTADGAKVIEVSIDSNNLISELDEFNNQATKILFVGQNPLMSGGIRVLFQAPTTAAKGSMINITGRADYALLINGEPNYDYPVKGGTINLQVKTVEGTIVMTQSGWFTDREGNFELNFELPDVVYPYNYAIVKIIVTDHTYIGYSQAAIYVYQQGQNIAENYDSADIDGDGILNFEDNDMDGDGIPNGIDSDMDGDGIPNTDDPVIGGPVAGDPDIDGDGVPNYYDDDIDGDGISNSADSTPYGGGSSYASGSGGGFGSGSGSGISSSASSTGSYTVPYSGFGNISIPSGGKIYTGTGESTTGYQGDPIILNDSSFDAYIHSRDIIFSNDNPELGEEINIVSVVWADGFGTVENIPVSVFEVYPAIMETQIGQTQFIPQLSAGSNYSILTSWQSFYEGLYIIEVRLSPDFTDINAINNKATRAIVVGELNQLLDVVIDLPLAGMTFTSLKDTIEVKFEVWNGFTMLTPDDLDTLVLKFSGSMAMVNDIVVIQNGEMKNAEFNPLNNVFTVRIPAPLPVGESQNGLYPASIGVIAQLLNQDEVLNGSDEENVNLTTGAQPPSSLTLFATSYGVQLTWPQVEGITSYAIYRGNQEIARVISTDINGTYTYIDYNVVRESTYEYFVTSVDPLTNKDGIITSPVKTITVPSRRRR